MGTRSERRLVRSPVIHHEGEAIDRRAGAACASREEQVKAGCVSDIKSRVAPGANREDRQETLDERSFRRARTVPLTSVYHSGGPIEGLRGDTPSVGHDPQWRCYRLTSLRTIYAKHHTLSGYPPKGSELE